MGATENAFHALVQASGVPLRRSVLFPWLTNRGHREPLLRAHLPADALDALSSIYRDLGGDEPALLSKRGRSLPVDFVMGESSLLELDEIQHFTSDRLRTFDHYSSGVHVGFDLDDYRAKIARWRDRADGYRRTKPAIGFSGSSGRRAQRAYYDALRDFAAPFFIGPIRRVPAPECGASIAFGRFKAS